MKTWAWIVRSAGDMDEHEVIELHPDAWEVRALGAPAYYVYDAEAGAQVTTCTLIRAAERPTDLDALAARDQCERWPSRTLTCAAGVPIHGQWAPLPKPGHCLDVVPTRPGAPHTVWTYTTPEDARRAALLLEAENPVTKCAVERSTVHSWGLMANVWLWLVILANKEQA